jgi:hypothetical protein
MHFLYRTERASMLPAGPPAGCPEETNVNIQQLIRSEEQEILDEAATAVRWLAHYRRDAGRIPERLATLCHLLVGAVERRDLAELLEHARGVAEERRAAGYGLREVQLAFAALEEAIWHRASTRLPEAERVWGLSLVDTAMAHARVALERAFSELEPEAAEVAQDLTPVFRGAEAAGRTRAAEEMVYPV